MLWLATSNWLLAAYIPQRGSPMPSKPSSIGLLILTLFALRAAAAPPDLAATERAYADFNDAYGAIGLIDSGWTDRHDNKTRAQWVAIYTGKRGQVEAALAQIDPARLGKEDARAVQLMRDGLAAADLSDSLAPTRQCSDAQQSKDDSAPLRQALYACFAELANNLAFEGNKVTRVGAFDLLTRMNEPERRNALFMAFVPLWRAVNADNSPGSPYRRVIRMAAAEAKDKGSPIDAAAKTLGTSQAEIERWLVQVLEAWRDANEETQIEPWDYRHQYGQAERAFAETIARDSLQPINQRYFADLGADLRGWGVIYDLDPRAGKAPLAYTDYVRRGRWVGAVWQPTLVRVSGNYARGGLGLLNELVHENGHAVHMMALQTRPAFMDLGDALFYEAFADVPSWSTYEPAWQRKYLGRSAPEAASLRGLYATVMLDVAWALFELRMLHEPTQDPNALWTRIAHEYLRIKPRPELAWWAMRVQLVSSPGYMVNYGLGAIVTADLRQRIVERFGAYESGNPRWYPQLREHLLESGQQRPTAELLRDFLGRPVSPQALLDDLKRLKATHDRVREGA